MGNMTRVSGNSVQTLPLIPPIVHYHLLVNKVKGSFKKVKTLMSLLERETHLSVKKLSLAPPKVYNHLFVKKFKNSQN